MASTSPTNLKLEAEALIEERHTVCPKNLDHENFIPVSMFCMKQLPLELQNERNMGLIQSRIDQTVRVKVSFISDRPDYFQDNKSPYPYSKWKNRHGVKRYGTGSIIRLLSTRPLKLSCHCPSCRCETFVSREHYMVVVRTATHVVFDSEEAKHCEFHCFFDSSDSELKKLYGLYVTETYNNDTDYLSDVCEVVCTTVDFEIFFRIWTVLMSSHIAALYHGLSYVHPPPDMIVSHPHGYSKQISVGFNINLIVPIEPEFDHLEPNRFHLETRYYATPDDVHQLPLGANFTLPPNASYAFRYHRDGNKRFFLFPPGTTFAQSDGTPINLSDDTKFINCTFYPKAFYIDYAIPTCHGSSGATVYCDFLGNPTITCFSHLGSMSRHVGRSEVHLKTTFPPPTLPPDADERMLSSYFDYDDSEDPATITDESDSMSAHFPSPESRARFIPVREFCMNDLPVKLQNKETMNLIRLRCDQTVKITVSYVSAERPQVFPDGSLYMCAFQKGQRYRFCGTGSIHRFEFDFPIEDVPCPCQICDLSNEPKWKHWRIIVRTSAHVVYNDEEARNAKFELFYDYSRNTEGHPRVKTLFGLCLDDSFRTQNKMYETDISEVVCVTHDEEIKDLLIRRLRHIFKAAVHYGLNYLPPPAGVIVSHPDGRSKHISVGSIKHLTVPLGTDYTINQRIPFDHGTRYRLPLPSTHEEQEIDNRHGREEKTLSPGTTFTFSTEATFAKRYHEDSPGWWRFPHGTTYTLPDGSELSLPDDSEFICETSYPKCCTIIYHTDTSGGSSGAAVHCDLLGNPLMTHFLHRGVCNSGNTSATYENVVFTLG